MKNIKKLFTSAPKGSTCAVCKKRFKPVEQNQVYCSDNCSRVSEWENLSRNHARQSHSTRTTPRWDLDSVIEAVRASPGMRMQSPSISNAYYPTLPRSRAQSVMHLQTNRDSPGRPRPLERAGSMPKHPLSLTPKRPLAEYMHSYSDPRRILRSPPPPYPRPSSAGNTPGHALSSVPLLDEDECSSWDESSPKSPGRNLHSLRNSERPGSEASSETYWSPSPIATRFPRTMTSSNRNPDHSDTSGRTSPTLVGDSPTWSGRYQSMHNNPNSRPTFTHYPLPNPSTAAMPDNCDARARPRATSNALGLKITPFLIRQPSHPPSFPSLSKLPSERPTYPVPIPPHLHYQDNEPRLRPGYEHRRGPRPRSRSFGGFQVPTVRA
ncbi:hypothetical protein C8Q74DRAFT_859821 [Fomes fomentarius]|nr:hypothetical protein C8Q74DRAFT_859821 [Fomes fomentarius]